MANVNGLTDVQIKQGYSTIPGPYSPLTGLLNPNVSTSAIAPATPLNIAGTYPPVPIDNGASVVAGAEAGNTAFKDDYNKYLDLQNANKDSSMENAIAGLSTDLQGLQGRGAAQSTAESSTGVPQFSADLAALNGQIGTEIAAYNKSIADQDAEQAKMEAEAGAKGLTTGMLLGQQGAVAKVRATQNTQKAAEIGILQARALGLQGQKDAAQKAADRAVDLLFQDRQAAVDIKTKQLELLMPLFTASEKRKADAMAYALKKEDEKIAQDKQDAKDVQAQILDAQANLAPANILKEANDLALKGGTPLQIATILGTYSGAAGKAALLREQIKSEQESQKTAQAQRAKIYADLEASKAGGNTLLTIDEATKLGVPYGTTKAQAIAASLNIEGKRKPLNELETSAFTSAKYLNEKLNKSNGFLDFFVGSTPVGKASLGPTMPGSKRSDFLLQYNNLKSLLSLDNVKFLKGQGAVSDAERDLLAAASTRLNTASSPEEFQTTLNEIIRVFNEASPEYQYTLDMQDAINNPNAGALTPGQYADSLQLTQ